MGLSAAPGGARTDLHLLVEAPSVLTWRYETDPGTYRRLYERAAREQWVAATDIDWTLDPADGRVLTGHLQLPDSWRKGRGESAQAAFDLQFQSWMISQFLHGEQAALVAAARMAEAATDLDAKLCFSTQVADEARHVTVFRRYVGLAREDPYPPAPALLSLIRDSLASTQPDLLALGVQILVEALALSTFRLAASTGAGSLLRQILNNLARDEARHVAMGTVFIAEETQALSPAQRKEREDFVLAATDLVARRFLLEEVWERLGVDPAKGADFARHSPLMAAYKNAIFLKVVLCLRRTGLLSTRLADGLEQCGFGPALRRATLGSRAAVRALPLSSP